MKLNSKQVIQFKLTKFFREIYFNASCCRDLDFTNFSVKTNPKQFIQYTIKIQTHEFFPWNELNNKQVEHLHCGVT